MKSKPVIIGYSGHSYVVHDIFTRMGYEVIYYCDREEKDLNPFNLIYLGDETYEKSLTAMENSGYFISIGDNIVRSKIQSRLYSLIATAPVNAIHPSAVISKKVKIGKGVMVAANVSINPLAKIGDGVICNTSCIIEHECHIGNYVHIAPGAVLTGNVIIGDYTFVGANSVIKQGVKIGKNVTIGAGTVVIKDIPDNVTVVGNPQHIIKNK